VKINDAIWGALFIAGATAVLIHIQAFPKIPGQNVGPALFPGVVAAGIAICGLILVVRGLRARAGAGFADHAAGRWMILPPWLRSGRHVAGFLVLVGVNAFYLFAVDKLGFLITGFVYLLGLMWVLRVRLARAVPIAIVMTLVIHYAFYKLLKVPLPWGVLTPFAW
jgi:putative tricarboxylic transport membrane protein